MTARRKIPGKSGIAAITAFVVFFVFLFLTNEIGVSKSRLQQDIRMSQGIDEDWIVTGDVSDTMAAFLSCPPDRSDHVFSVYVNRPGFSFGYFFRSGGSLSEVESKIARFTLDGYNEAAFISLNRQKTSRVEIHNGNAVEVMELDSGKPFAIVLPRNAGTVIFYDVDGNPVKTWEHPM